MRFRLLGDTLYILTDLDATATWLALACWLSVMRKIGHVCLPITSSELCLTGRGWGWPTGHNNWSHRSKGVYCGTHKCIIAQKAAHHLHELSPEARNGLRLSLTLLVLQVSSFVLYAHSSG